MGKGGSASAFRMKKIVPKKCPDLLCTFVKWIFFSVVDRVVRCEVSQHAGRGRWKWCSGTET
jgi:hypothetical protein